ncbi:hypothetical protein Hanom_Chr17g01567381 [Helianthus anomalus]
MFTKFNEACSLFDMNLSIPKKKKHVNYRHGSIDTNDCGLIVRDSSQYMITTVIHACNCP